MTVFVPLSTQPVFYQGSAVVGAKIRVYDAGTLTPRTVYRDGLANATWDQPIDSDANGTIPEMWVVGNPIKIRITTPGGVLIREIDNIPGDVAAGGGEGGGGGTTIPPGFMMPAHLTGAISGWVRANGRTIGNTISGATERANDDTELCFTALWNADSTLVVLGGRGASAASDFAANKTIALPDYRGKGFVGVDGMGSSAAGLLAGALFNSGDAITLGSFLGEATHSLTTAELASHTHTGTVSTSANHQHTGTVDAGGLHGHSASTFNAGNHQHSIVGTGAALISPGGTAIQQPAGSTATGFNGDHSHSISVADNGFHAHAFTSDAAGSHNHTFTSDASGSGTAHNNVQPSNTCTIYIKL